MRGWDELSLDALRAELDSYAGEPKCPASEGWRTIGELAAQFGVAQHTMSLMLAEYLAHGRVEQGERHGRRRDGVRCKTMVYRWVEKQ